MSAVIATTAPDCIENHTFSELVVGESVRIRRTLTLRDIELCDVVSGANAMAITPEQEGGKPVADGMWASSLIWAVLETQLPGPGTIHLSQDLHFHAPVALGDTVDV